MANNSGASPNWHGNPGGEISFLTVNHERQIPLFSFDLQRYLLADEGLSETEREQLGRLCHMLREFLHRDYLSWSEAIRELYAPLDPDSESVSIRGATAHLEENADERFLQAFETVMFRANFRELHLAEVLEAVRASNEAKLNYEPRFELLEHVRVFVRGRTTVKRKHRNLGTWFRLKEIELEAFRRMVVAVKFKPSEELGPLARTDAVFLRLFKDVPYVDMEMHLPEQATRIKMRIIDKAQIASPLLIGLPVLAFNLLTASLLNPMAIGGVLFPPISAGVKSFFGFRQAKQNHLHFMIRNLYYLTLANNVGTIHWLSNAAEEEDFKEIILAYWFLNLNRNQPAKCTARALDAQIESLVKQLTVVPVDFEIDDALRNLVKLGLAQRLSDGSYHALAPEAALRSLDEQWDNFFPYFQKTRRETRRSMKDSPETDKN